MLVVDCQSVMVGSIDLKALMRYLASSCLGVEVQGQNDVHSLDGQAKEDACLYHSPGLRP